jgi:two-component system sensor histidine kinase BaeS
MNFRCAPPPGWQHPTFDDTLHDSNTRSTCVRIQYKIFLAILGSSLVLVATVLLLVQWSVARGMLDYVNQRQEQRAMAVAGELAEFYREQGNWQLLRHSPRVLHQLIFNAMDSEPRRSPRMIPAPPPRLAVLDETRRLIAGDPPTEPYALMPIELQGETVGWLVVPKMREIRTGFEEQFLRRQRSTLWLIGAALVAVAALIALPLARHLVKPIRQLARGTHQLTQGNYAVTLPVVRRDELGELARDFNELALALAANETSRKRWLADISHELRTPLAILRGELEAMLDQVRALDTDNLHSLNQEVQHLTRLVDDLYSLTTADIGGLQYRKVDCDIAELWREQCEAHIARFTSAGLELRIEIPATEIFLYGDEDRLLQLLDNLLDNSRKYTSAGGVVRVAVTESAGGVELRIEDSAPAVPVAALPKLFDHLFRVEDSRNRSTGGSGLGLAICQRIVAAHQGTISAELSALGGLCIRVHLPHIDQPQLAAR